MLWVGVIHLYSNNLSIIATITSSTLFVSLPAGFSWILKRNLAHSLFGFSERKVTLRVTLASCLFDPSNPKAPEALSLKKFLYRISISDTFSSCSCIIRDSIHQSGSHFCIQCICCIFSINSILFLKITF